MIRRAQRTVAVEVYSSVLMTVSQQLSGLLLLFFTLEIFFLKLTCPPRSCWLCPAVDRPGAAGDCRSKLKESVLLEVQYTRHGQLGSAAAGVDATNQHQTVSFQVSSCRTHWTLKNQSS